ncbi:HTH domain-containing protein [Agrobacterium vitis]
MNSYLRMAISVLSKSRSAMSAREILEAAYRLQLVPEHLFGKTQFKTLHARLSEDILRNRNNSAFTRTAPGRFTLRTLLPDSDMSRGEYVAPQRAYQLKQFDVLCADAHELSTIVSDNAPLFLFRLIAPLFQKQLSLKRADRYGKLVQLRLLVIIRCRDRVLTVSALDAADTGTGRSFGFLGYIKGDDANLFSAETFGVDTAAHRTISEQSMAPAELIETLSTTTDFQELRCLRIEGPAGGSGSVVLLAGFECRDPDEFLAQVPAHRSPRWTRLPSGINDISTLEPVSRKLMTANGHEAIL